MEIKGYFCTMWGYPEALRSPAAIAAVAATAAEEEVPAAVVAEAQDASNKQFNKYNYEKDGNYTFADDCRSIRICPDSI